MEQKCGQQNRQKSGGRGPQVHTALFPTRAGREVVGANFQIRHTLYTYPRLLKTVSTSPVFYVLILFCLLKFLSQALYPVMIVRS